MQIFDDLYEVGGVRSKLPDGSGPDRTPLPPRTPVRSGPYFYTVRIAAKKLIEADGFFTPEFRRNPTVDAHKTKKFLVILLPWTAGYQSARRAALDRPAPRTPLLKAGEGCPCY